MCYVGPPAIIESWLLVCLYVGLTLMLCDWGPHLTMAFELLLKCSKPMALPASAWHSCGAKTNYFSFSLCLPSTILWLWPLVMVMYMNWRSDATCGCYKEDLFCLGNCSLRFPPGSKAISKYEWSTVLFFLLSDKHWVWKGNKTLYVLSSIINHIGKVPSVKSLTTQMKFGVFLWNS